MFTYDAGRTWLAKIAVRGLDVNFNTGRLNSDGDPIRSTDQCVPKVLLGSCCYDQANLERTFDVELFGGEI